MRARETCGRRRPLLPALAVGFLALALHGRAAALPPSAPGGSGPTPSARGLRELLADPNVRDALVRLWRCSGGGGPPMECAAWIVQPGGAPELVLWTAATGSHRATWRGPVPAFAVGLVHTHPRGDDPRPSRRDVATARELRLPVTVVTRSALWTASAEGVVAQEGDASWTVASPSR